MTIGKKDFLKRFFAPFISSFSVPIDCLSSFITIRGRFPFSAGSGFAAALSWSFWVKKRQIVVFYFFFISCVIFLPYLYTF